MGLTMEQKIFDEHTRKKFSPGPERRSVHVFCFFVVRNTFFVFDLLSLSLLSSWRLSPECYRQRFDTHRPDQSLLDSLFFGIER